MQHSPTANETLKHKSPRKRNASVNTEDNVEQQKKKKSWFSHKAMVKSFSLGSMSSLSLSKFHEFDSSSDKLKSSLDTPQSNPILELPKDIMSQIQIEKDMSIVQNRRKSSENIVMTGKKCLRAIKKCVNQFLLKFTRDPFKCIKAFFSMFLLIFGFILFLICVFEDEYFFESIFKLFSNCIKIKYPSNGIKVY